MSSYRRQFFFIAMNESPSSPSSAPHLPDLDRYIDTSAAMLGLTLTPESHTAVLRNLTSIHGIAQAVLSMDLPPSQELAPTFSPDCHD